MTTMKRVDDPFRMVNISIIPLLVILITSVVYMVRDNGIGILLYLFFITSIIGIFVLVLNYLYPIVDQTPINMFQDHIILDAARKVVVFDAVSIQISNVIKKNPDMGIFRLNWFIFIFSFLNLGLYLIAGPVIDNSVYIVFLSILTLLVLAYLIIKRAIDSRRTSLGGLSDEEKNSPFVIEKLNSKIKLNGLIKEKQSKKYLKMDLIIDREDLLNARIMSVFELSKIDENQSSLFIKSLALPFKSLQKDLTLYLIKLDYDRYEINDIPHSFDKWPYFALFQSFNRQELKNLKPKIDGWINQDQLPSNN